MKILLCLTWGLIAFVGKVSSCLAQQNYVVDTRFLSVSDGLSNRFVYSICKDSRGFMWMGTSFGLNRFDGYQFKVFSKEESGLTDNNIRQIGEDINQKLWVCYRNNVDAIGFSAIDIIDIHTYQIMPIQSYIPNHFEHTEDIVSLDICKHTPYVFWINRSFEVYSFDGTEVKLLAQLDRHDYLASRGVEIVYDEDMGCVWVGFGQYIYAISTEGGIERSIRTSQDVRMVGLDKNGNIVGGVDYGSQVLTINNRKEAVLNDMEDYWLPLSFGYDIRQLYFFSSKVSPIEVVTARDKSLKICLRDATDAWMKDISYLFRHKRIHDVFFENEQNIWLATDDGVCQVTLKPNYFTNYLKAHSSDSVKHSIRGITTDESGLLYVNSYSGKYKINPYQRSIESWINTNARGGLLKTRDGYLWSTSEYDPLVERYNPVDETILRLSFVDDKGQPRTKTDSERGFSMLEDRKGRLWVGGIGGLHHIDTVVGVVRPFYSADYPEISTIRIQVFLENKTGIWIGTERGLYFLDTETQKITQHYSTQTAIKIPHDDILSIHQDHENTLWLGTKGGGLIHWEPQKKIAQQYTRKDGLSDNIIYTVLEDNFGGLWLASNCGLMLFDKGTTEVRTYMPRNGIAHEEFNYLSYHQEANGHIYLGGLNGINRFDPADFYTPTSDTIKVPLLITGIERLDGESGEMLDYTMTYNQQKRIILDNTNSSFMIKYALLDFYDTKNHRYAYRIPTLNKNWTYTKENFIHFHRMPYGKYTLELKAQGSDGVWYPPIYVELLMEQPIYMEWYFWVSIGVLVVLLFVGFYRLRIVRLRRINEALESEVSRRTKSLVEREQELLKAKEAAEASSKAKAEFLSVMSHELRTPLNGVVGITNILLDNSNTLGQKGDLQILKYSADNLLALINDILDFSKIESGKIELEQVAFDLHELMKAVYHPMGYLAEEKSLDFRLIIDTRLNQTWIGDPTRLMQVLNNLVSNALKFTEKGSVMLGAELLTMSETAAEIIFFVEDTGIGIPKDKQEAIFNLFTQARSDTTRKYGGTGLGLAITKRLTTLMGSQIFLESEEKKGTRFSFKVKLKRANDAIQKGSDTQNKASELQGIQVLLVEDNKINMLVTKKFCDKWGIVMQWAKSGEEALFLIGKQQFDLILMDLEMPNMDGYQTTEAIRAMEGTNGASVPIIALTASALLEDKDKVLAAGMNDFVMKPFSPQYLYEKMMYYIQQNRKQIVS